MKVSEIKALVPLAEVYELKPDARYIVMVPFSEPAIALEALSGCGVHGVIVCAEEPDRIRFMEMN